MNRIPKIIDLPDIKKCKIGVIYVYYERKNEQKNQTNLSFFLKYALNQEIWENIDINYLFIINGHQCEVNIPSKPNVFVLKEYNCHDWEAYYNGIQYFENKFNKKIWELFDYLCLVNCSVLGPIMESSIKTHWLYPFYEKMKKDNAVACSPCMSFLPETDGGGIGPKLVATFTLLKINEEIIELLTNTKISYCDETSISEDAKIKQDNTVLGVKYSKNDAVYTGEYGLSRVLLKYNYNITSLLYDNIDIYDEKNWKINNNISPDRYNAFNGQNIPLSTIFIKNIWRWDDWYASYPVLYDETIEFVYKKSNMKNIFTNNSQNNIVYNYDLLFHTFYKNKSLKFDIKYTENVYNSFQRQEEVILFTKFTENKKYCAIYSHYDEDDIIKDYVIQGLKTLIYSGYDILFITNCKTINNIDILPFDIIHVENNTGKNIYNFLIGCSIIKKNNLHYERILLIDDNILFPINGIENFKNTVYEIRKDCDVWSHLDNFLINTILPIEFKINLIDIIINIMYHILQTNDNINIIEFLKKSGYIHKTIINKEQFNNDDNTLYNPEILCQWLYNNNTFAINWNLFKPNINLFELTPEFNYLIRYLHT